MGGVSGRRLLPLVAGAHLCTALTLLVSAALTGLSVHAPLAWPGAAGMPGALTFNLLAWILPGLALAVAAIRLRALVPAAGMATGIVLRLMLIAALAVAAQGLFPLDPEAMERSSRWHASAWMLWHLAFVAGALLSGVALAAVRWPALALGAVVTVCLLAPDWLGAGLADRAVLLCWWAWTALLAWRLPRPR